MSEKHTHIVKAKLLSQLCKHLCGKENKEASVAHLFKIAKDILEERSGPPSQDEVIISEKIRKRLSTAHGDGEAFRYVDLHRRLKSANVLKKRAEVLSLLLQLSNLPGSDPTAPEGILDMPLSTLPSMETLSLRSKETSWESNWENNNATNNTMSFNTSNNSTGGRPHILNYSSPRVNWQESKELNGFGRTPTSVTSPSLKTHSTLSASDQQYVSEHVLIQELLYCFQGIEGKVLKLEPVTNGFVVDPKVRLPLDKRRLVEQLVGIGLLHNKLRAWSDSGKQRTQIGLIAQALNTIVTDEFTEFYRILAVMQSQLHQQTDRGVDSPMSEGTSRGSAGSPSQTPLTLRQLEVYVEQPYERLDWLVAICEACQDKRGGALASVVHSFLKHGDQNTQNCVRRLLVAVCKPLYAMLSRWILDGELEDPFSEFFIQINPHIKSDDQLWHEKYKVRKSMVPSFISMAQAQKILATGKSINFLRQVCEDHSPISGREVLRQALENSSVEAMFLSDRDGELQALMDTAYLEISRRVLDVLNTKYKFMEHMQALRRYLLLGQGDFIRHLMELLEPELRKQASDLYTHNLTGILESAVRATNAQFEDASILRRLDVRLLEQSPGDTGWDVFSLDYHVDGPISTVFSSSLLSYLMLFNALWRAKRTEWILSQMWKRLTTSAKMLPRIPELTPVLQQTYLLSAEMIHLVHQLQYYFLFEVIECSWDKLISNVQQADGLDDIIKAHNQFLDRIKAGTLVDDSSQELATQLRTVYDLAVQLQSQEEKLHSRVLREVQRQGDYASHIEEHGTNSELEAQDKAATKDFVENFLASTRVSLRVLAQSYQDVVKRFLLLLASHSDMSLQLLSSRLDFNEHYKRHDSRLTVPLTYQHRRQSEITISSALPMSTFRSPSQLF